LCGQRSCGFSVGSKIRWCGGLHVDLQQREDHCPRPRDLQEVPGRRGQVRHHWRRRELQRRTRCRGGEARSMWRQAWYPEHLQLGLAILPSLISSSQPGAPVPGEATYAGSSTNACPRPSIEACRRNDSSSSWSVLCSLLARWPVRRIIRATRSSTSSRYWRVTYALVGSISLDPQTAGVWGSNTRARRRRASSRLSFASTGGHGQPHLTRPGRPEVPPN
jgi:hypothetical protein